MRRLSIIGVANGHQPIFNEDRGLALVLNGEIYNYQELKGRLARRGHRFATDSDAEVVVHLYEEHGAACLDYLRGMFALALYDRSRERLFLARDPAGKKPLYLARRDGLLLFASEIKALFASGLVAKHLDVQALPAYLAFGHALGETTLFAGVSKLPAATWCTASRGGIEQRRYWDYPSTAAAPRLGFEEAAARLRAALEEAVRRRLMSEVPLGAFLSGGIDSAAVVGIMSGLLERPVETFSVGFDDPRLSELTYARIAAARFGTAHHEVRVAHCTPALLRQVNWHYDEPAADPANVPTFVLSRFARERVTVVLTGEGGDETFAGYRHYRLARRIEELETRVPGLRRLAAGLDRLEPLFGRLTPPRAVKATWLSSLPPQRRIRGWLSAFTDAQLARLLRSPHRDCFRSGFDAAFARILEPCPRADPLARHLYLDSKSSLAEGLLMKVDKMSMAASLEARCPLLDRDLQELAWSMPSDFKLAGQSKLVLRRAIADLVPSEIRDRPKHGFDVPLDRWLLDDLEPLVREALLADDSPLHQYLEAESVRALWSAFRHRPDERAGAQLWRLLNLAVWHEIHWPTGLRAFECT